MPKRNSLRMMRSQMPTCREIITMCAAEMVGTAILILFGCMGGVDRTSMAGHLTGCLAFGMVVMLVITTFGHVSQAHLNPAVTICAAMLGGIPVLLAPLYCISQIIGGTIGYGILKFVVPDSLFYQGLCVTKLHEEVTLSQGFIIELMATSVLILVCCGAWDHRSAAHMDSLPLKFGFTITSLALLVGPLTGCSMNPARSFGPALFNNFWNYHWLYWLAPCFAAVLATSFYMMVFSKSKNDEETDTVEDMPLRNK
uniref:Aquaporin-1 n=1 Tax=Chrysoperla nipponensis TaxID=413239 RepID=A0A1U9Y652_CHRNP|nr:aquaporin-1 [Chrysoperla nipponensis]